MEVYHLFPSFRFHRVRKRQQRRELIKEVEGLLVRDPARAGERVEELERDRAYERATLKHRGTNKWTKQVREWKEKRILRNMHILFSLHSGPKVRLPQSGTAQSDGRSVAFGPGAEGKARG
jgi:hypothetical protein